MRKTMALHVRHKFWYISLPSSAKQQREVDQIQGFVENVSDTWQRIIILCLNVNAVPINSVPG